MVLDSSTVITPSLPTLSNASAISSPMTSSRLETVATAAMSSRSSTSRAALLSASLTASVALSMPRLRPIGLAPAATVAQALVHHRLGEHGRGRRAVTGDVVGLGGDFLGELGAEVLERVVQLDLAGDGDTVVGDGGRAPLLVEHDVAALGAERHLDGVGELVDAALEERAGVLVELQDLGHAVAPFVVKAVADAAPGGRPSGRAALSTSTTRIADQATIASTSRRGEDEVLLAGVLDLGAAVLAVDDLVADGDVQRNALVAVFVEAAGADGHDLALLGLLLGGVRDDQAGGRGLLGVKGLDDDPVLERLDVDRHF